MSVEGSQYAERLRPADPRRIGQYRLMGRLGSGSMGIVYLAQAMDGRSVAVKAIHPHLAEQDGFRQRFRHEVVVARRVPSYCTAAVLDADVDADLPYLVLELFKDLTSPPRLAGTGGSSV